MLNRQLGIMHNSEGERNVFFSNETNCIKLAVKHHSNNNFFEFVTFFNEIIKHWHKFDKQLKCIDSLFCNINT